MRLSKLIAKVEDRVVADAPKVQARAQHTVARSAGWLSAKLAKLADKAAPKSEVQQG